MFADDEVELQATFIPYADVLVEVKKGDKVVYLDAFFTEETPAAFNLPTQEDIYKLSPLEYFRDILVNLSTLIRNNELEREIEERAMKAFKYLKERFEK
jgi:hypothetical protein